MSSDLFLTHANSYLTENVKTVYLDKMSEPTGSPDDILSFIPHDMSWSNDTYRWGVKDGLFDGTAYGLGNFGAPGDESVRVAQVTLNMMTQRFKIDRRSMKFSKNKRDAHIKLLDDGMRDMADGRRRTILNSLIRPTLGTIATGGVTDNGSGSYTIVLTDASWASGAFVKGTHVNVGTSTDLFRVRDIDLDARSITILRDSGGTKVPTDGDLLYPNLGKDNQPVSLQDIVQGSGTLHGLARQFEWEATHFDLAGDPADEDIYEELVAKIYQRSGEYPDLLIMSVTQELRLRRTLRENMIRIMDAMVEGTGKDGKQKVYRIPNATHMLIGGRLMKVVSHPSIPRDTIYMINTKHLEIVSAGPGEFIKGPDGGVLHPLQIHNQIDAYEAQWVYDFAIRCENPKYHGGITGAASDLTFVQGL